MLKLLSLFSGIGAFEKALTNIGEPFEVVNYCEIDKYASKAYSLIHNIDENMNLGDITAVDTKELPNDIDIITYGFPCQDISNAGKMTGFVNDEGEITRSGLFFQALRIIKDTQPKIAIAENVKALTGKRFTAEFKIVLDSLNDAGYKNYWKVLNAKDYGVPQNRERVFIISIREDIAHGFKFPEKHELKLKLKDLLEESVDEKFYIDASKIAKIKNSNFAQEKQMIQTGEVRGTLLARDYKDPKCVPEFVNKDVCKTVRASGHGSVDRHSWDMVVEPQMKQVGQIYGTEREPNPQAGRIYDADGISPTMDTCSGGNRMPKVLVKEATKQGYAEAVEGDSINLEQPNSKTRRGRVGHGVAQTLTTSPQQGVVVGNRWIDTIGSFKCSSCGSYSEFASKFCPECGAKMIADDMEGGVCNEQ